MKRGAVLLLLLAALGTALYLLRSPPSPAVTPDHPPPPVPRKARQKALLPAAPAEGGGVPEAQVKAALLLQILRHTPWPAPDTGKEAAPVLVGVLGISPVGDELHLTAMDKQIGPRPVRVVRGNDSAELPPCHLLFIPRGWRDDWDLIFPSVRKSGVLLVGEEEGFLAAGGGILSTVAATRAASDIGTMAARISAPTPEA